MSEITIQDMRSWKCRPDKCDPNSLVIFLAQLAQLLQQYKLDQYTQINITPPLDIDAGRNVLFNIYIEVFVSDQSGNVLIPLPLTVIKVTADRNWVIYTYSYPATRQVENIIHTFVLKYFNAEPIQEETYT